VTTPRKKPAVTPGRPRARAAEKPNDLEVMVDLNEISVGEIEEIEDLAGMPFDTVFDPKARKGKILRAIATVVRQRTDPSFTFEEAGKLRLLQRVGKVPPTVPNG
jgi:hypothetical protein